MGPVSCKHFIKWKIMNYKGRLAAVKGKKKMVWLEVNPKRMDRGNDGGENHPRLYCLQMGGRISLGSDT
jgi:hypothetical protein